MEAAKLLFKGIREAEEILELPSGTAQPLIAASADWVCWTIDLYPFKLILLDRSRHWPGAPFQAQLIDQSPARVVTNQHVRWLPWQMASKDLEALYKAIDIYKQVCALIPLELFQRPDVAL